MKTFDFTIILSGKDDISEADAAKLCQAGCDDAVPGASGGLAVIHFNRDADSLQEAILSARSDVESAGFEVDRASLGSIEIDLLAAS